MFLFTDNFIPEISDVVQSSLEEQGREMEGVVPTKWINGGHVFGQIRMNQRQ